MPAAPPSIEELLEPIPVAGMPAGIDMRWTPEWDRLKEARRSDDEFEPGKWRKLERKSADWSAVEELAREMLRDRAKDLQIAMWLTEAAVRLRGFPGLRDGLRLARGLMEEYWDRGLFPQMEDGPEDRSGPFEWMNARLADCVRRIAVTRRADGGRDYNTFDYEDARRIGSAAGCVDAEGDGDPVKRRAFEASIAQGHVSLDMFNAAVVKTERPAMEELAAEFMAAREEFKALEKAIDERFGDVAPHLGAFRDAVETINQAVSAILENRRKAFSETPASNSAEQKSQSPAATAGSITMRFNLPIGSAQEPQATSDVSWRDAENLVRSGEVEKGLAEMTRLAVNETTGRNRFHRKLLLAQVCLNSGRDRIARSILEELSEQIDKFHLEEWESSELIADVWAGIYRIYRQSEDSELAGLSAKYFERLCRLDPWQALKCAGA